MKNIKEYTSEFYCSRVLLMIHVYVQDLLRLMCLWMESLCMHLTNVLHPICILLFLTCIQVAQDLQKNAANVWVDAVTVDQQQRWKEILINSCYPTTYPPSSDCVMCEPTSSPLFLWGQSWCLSASLRLDHLWWHSGRMKHLFEPWRQTPHFLVRTGKLCTILRQRFSYWYF